MCKQCGEMQHEMHQQIKEVSDLYSQIQYGSSSAWEYSEPMVVGGPGQPKLYTLASPFQNIVGQEYRVETAIAGQGNGLFLVSANRASIIPGLLSTDTGTTHNTPITGILFACPSNSSVPICSSWYVLVDSSNRLFVTVSSSQAVYVTIQFRIKR
jgi:hypothetical protein